MNLTIKDLENFRQLYKKCTGITLSDKETKEKASNILNLFIQLSDINSNRCYNDK